jgi:hypothetical protein
MKVLTILSVTLLIFSNIFVYSQDWTNWKADSTRIQIVKTKDGSKIKARVIEIHEDRVTIKIFSATIDLPTDSIQSIKIEDRVVLDQDGRTKLIAASTALAMGYYSWGIPTALRIRNTRTFAATYMFISAGGFFIPYFMTKKTEVSDAAATTYIYGSTRGIVHGLALYSLINGLDYSHRTAIGLSVTASITEGIGFYHLAGKMNYTGGRAEAIGTFGDFGLVNIGVFAPIVLDIEESRTIGTMMLAGSGLGLGLGHYFTAKQEFTRGDAYAMTDAGLLGGYAAMTAAFNAGSKKPKAILAAAIAGSTLGLGFGYWLIRDKDFSTADGLLIRLSTSAGFSTGLGVGYLISKKPRPKLYTALTCLGAIGGYAIMFYSTDPLGEKKVSQADPVHFYFNPLTLLLNESGKSKTIEPFAGIRMIF